jgi:hypothetical protein
MTTNSDRTSYTHVLLGGPHEGVVNLTRPASAKIRYVDGSVYNLVYATGELRQYRFAGTEKPGLEAQTTELGGAEGVPTEGAQWAPPLGTLKPLQMRDSGGVPSPTPPSLEGGGGDDGHPVGSLHPLLEQKAVDWVEALIAEYGEPLGACVWTKAVEYSNKRVVTGPTWPLDYAEGLLREGQEMENREVEECGAFGCTRPRGHNMGKADVPSNHSRGWRYPRTWGPEDLEGRRASDANVQTTDPRTQVTLRALAGEIRAEARHVADELDAANDFAGAEWIAGMMNAANILEREADTLETEDREVYKLVPPIGSFHTSELQLLKLIVYRHPPKTNEDAALYRKVGAVSRAATSDGEDTVWVLTPEHRELGREDS